MIYALKLLAVVFTVTCIAAYLFKSAFRDLFTQTEYRRIWTLVLAGVVASYLCTFQSLFILAVAIIAIAGASITGRGPVGKVAVYLLLACTLPPVSMNLGGIGGINYILNLDHIRVTALVLLTWAAVELLTLKPPRRTVSLLWIDLLVVGYQCFKFALAVPHSSLTTLLRLLVEATLDILLPYFVVTRSIRTLSDVRFAVGHLFIGLVFVASVGVAETVLQHNVYSGLQSIYDVRWQQTYALMRGSLLRVQATTQQPIILAFMVLFALALGYWLNGTRWRRASVIALFATFLITLTATFSRGPWIAAGLIVLSILAMQRMPARAFRIVLVVAVLGGVGLKIAGADQQVVAALGAIFGSQEADLSSIEYRRQLLDTSLALVQQSPWFGVPNYAAQMQSLKQGEGIIDVVNSYVGIMLDSGVVGLAIYLLPFVIVLNRLISVIRRGERRRLDEASRFAVAMVALILGCLFAIFTTSTWGVMTLLMTMLLALPSAWLGLSPAERNAEDVHTDLELDIPVDPIPNRQIWLGGGLR